MRYLVIFLALLTAACVSHQQILVSPLGTAMTCQSHGSGMFGVAQADSIFKKCLREARAAGMVEIERAGAVGIVVSEDLRVLRVQPASPAAIAGLEPGDVLVAVDGQPVATRQDAILLMFGLAGDPVSVTVERAGERIAAALVRRPYPEIHGTAAP